MSWNITHQCRFQSRTHQQYCVNISKQADTGQNIVQLQASDKPFVTSEANGDDIFMPIRQQTGYLRVLDKSGGTLLEELMPENNTQKMVTLVNLTTGKTEWIGFLAAEVFTQPWGNELTELEFPLRSVLKCLEDVTIQTGVTGTNRLALLVYNAITSLFGEGQVPFTQLVFMDDFKNACTHMIMRADFGMFFGNETIMNDNTETFIRVGQTYKKAIEAMCQVFGITLREQGTTLIFGRYDNGGDFTVNVNTMDWSVLALISNSTSLPNIQPQGGIITKDILPIADFRNNNNKISFIQGGREAVVTLNIADAQSNVNSNILQMPLSEIKEGGIQTTHLSTKGDNSISDYYDFGGINYNIITNIIEYLKINFQWSERNESNETFYFFKARMVSFETDHQIIDNKYIIKEGKKIKDNTWQGSDAHYVMSNSVFSGHMIGFGTQDFGTGSFPGRWGEDGNVLENGLFLVQYAQRSNDNPAPCDSCYKIESRDGIEMQNCHLNINFDIPITFISTPMKIHKYISNNGENLRYYIDEGWFDPNLYLIYADDSFNLIKDSITYNMLCKLSIISEGITYYWNGSGWVQGYAEFSIPIKGGSIVSNYSSSMQIDNNGGFYVPVNITGKVIFEILNIVTSDSVISIQDNFIEGLQHMEVEVPIWPHQRILTGLSIDIVRSRDITVSTRGSNVYRKTIMSMGFSEDKEKSLNLGTWNNNLPSPSLLRNSANTEYIQNIEYSGADGSTVSERPEMHLLNRMVEQYKTMRRTMTAKIATGIDLFRNRFSYNGRKYMAIDKKHDWEREEQEVKFIEVT